MMKAVSRARTGTRSAKKSEEILPVLDTYESTNSNVSKPGSKIKRLGASLTGKKKGKGSLFSKSKSLFSKLSDKSGMGTPKSMATPKKTVLKNLIRHRKEYADPSKLDLEEEAEDESDIDTVDIDSASVSNEDDQRRRSYRDDSESSTSAAESPEIKRHRSVLRDGDRVSSKNKEKRVSSKRVSKRGFTMEEGFLTRSEAMSFSNRYSLQRNRAMTAEEVIGRNSISVKSLLRFAKHGDVDKVAALIQFGKLNVNACLEDGKTALMAAASHGHTATVVALYGLEADLELTDERGNTALIRAAQRGHLEVVLTLLSCGADSTCRNKDGETALIAAAQKIGTADDKRSFEDLLSIVRAFFERSIPDIEKKSIAEFGPEDNKLIQDDATKVLLNEWLSARIKRKDLHMPTHSTFKGTENKLLQFFHNSHNRLDLFGWIKVFLLLVFIVYDTYSPHFSDTYTTLAVYIALYLAAYNL